MCEFSWIINVSYFMFSIKSVNLNRHVLYIHEFHIYCLDKYQRKDLIFKRKKGCKVGIDLNTVYFSTGI